MGFFFGGVIESFFFFFCGVCKIRAGLHHPSHIYTHTHTHHSRIHAARPYLHLTSPPLPSMSLSLSLPPFLSLPLLGREMEQKVACNYILIFGWYLLRYRGCRYGELSHTHTHTHTHTQSHIFHRDFVQKSTL